MKKKQHKFLILYITGLFLVVMAVIFIFFINSSAYTLKENGFQVVAGNKKKYTSGTNFIYDETGPTYKGAQDNEYIVNSPIYLSKSKSIVIPDDSIYFSGRDSNFRRITSFSEVSNEKGLYINDVEVFGGFIYDGKNTFTFLEEMDLTINGKNVVVKAFSSITTTSTNTYSLYNTSDKTIQVDYIVTDSLEAKGVDYRIDIRNDIMYIQDDQKVLLFNRADLLEELD